MRKNPSCLIAFCAIFIASCGHPSGPTRLLVLGNSITHNSPNPPKGWFGNWGMAAPSAADDFAHLAASALNVPLTAENLLIERAPQASLPLIPIVGNQVGPGTAVVLEFGDDVPSGGLAAFSQDYADLAAAVSNGRFLVCLSTWWKNADVDDVIKSICGTYGGRYLYIGDLFTDPDNADMKVVQYSNPRLQAHPRRWGHQHIADRIILLIRHW